MKKSIYNSFIIIITLISLTIPFQGAHSQESSIEPTLWNPRDTSLASSYVFYLKYNQNTETLSQDPSLKFPYNIIVEEFVPDVSAQNAPFSLSVISRHGVTLAQASFDPVGLLKNTPTSNRKDSIIVKAPYSANAGSVIFYRNKENLFAISVLQSSFCNEDSICNAAIGESKFNCAIDCDQNYVQPATSTPYTNTNPPSNTASPPGSNNNIPPQNSTTQPYHETQFPVWVWIIGAFLFFVAFVAIISTIRKIKK